jgi:hypothetical protein
MHTPHSCRCTHWHFLYVHAIKLVDSYTCSISTESMSHTLHQRWAAFVGPLIKIQNKLSRGLNLLLGVRIVEHTRCNFKMLLCICIFLFLLGQSLTVSNIFKGGLVSLGCYHGRITDRRAPIDFVSPSQSDIILKTFLSTLWQNE